MMVRGSVSDYIWLFMVLFFYNGVKIQLNLYNYTFLIVFTWPGVEYWPIAGQEIRDNSARKKRGCVRTALQIACLNASNPTFLPPMCIRLEMPRPMEEAKSPRAPMIPLLRCLRIEAACGVEIGQMGLG